MGRMALWQFTSPGLGQVTTGPSRTASPIHCLAAKNYVALKAMEQSCHRCGTSVSREDAFCPTCGAPQLNFDLSSQEPIEAGSEPHAALQRPGQVNWRDAIGAAVTVALPAGILCGLPLLASGSLLWVMGGASLVILLYKKKRPMALLNARSGFRIGCLTGLVIAYVSVAVEAIYSVTQRFPMHGGATIDREYETVMSQVATSVQTTPETQAQVRAMFHFLLSPDGRAGSSFVIMVFITITTIIFASIGGYVGVRLFAGRRLA